MRRARLAIIAAILGAALGLGLCEAALRVFDMGYGNEPWEPHPTLHHEHPRGYAYRAYDAAGEWGGHMLHYDGQGSRIASPGRRADPDGARVRLAFVGDSFVHGTQVAWEETLVGRLQRRYPEVGMFNFGVPAYSPALYPILWGEKIARHRPTHVLLLLCTNDVDDDQRYTRLGVTTPDGRLVAVPGPRNGIIQAFDRRLYVVRLARKYFWQVRWILDHPGGEGRLVDDYVEENPELGPLTERYLDQLAAVVRASGARLAVSAVPSKVVLSGARLPGPEFAEHVRAYCQRRGLDYIDLVRPFHEAQAAGRQTFFKRDIHWTSAGMEVAAEAMARYYDPILAPTPSAATSPAPPRSR